MTYTLHRKFLVYSVAAAALFLCSINAQTNSTTNLIYDGDFSRAGSSQGVTTYKVFNATNIQSGSYPIIGWQTTASDNKIEVWKSGYDGVASPVDTQYFAEINANYEASLFQVVKLNQANPVSYSLAHRGRNGVDVMRLNIWDLGSNSSYSTNAPYATMVYTETMSDSNTAWRYYGNTNIFTAKAGDFYAFEFESVSAAGGNKSVGNFVSDIQFGFNVQEVPEPSTNALFALGAIGMMIALLRKKTA